MNFTKNPALLGFIILSKEILNFDDISTSEYIVYVWFYPNAGRETYNTATWWWRPKTLFPPNPKYIYFHSIINNMTDMSLLTYRSFFYLLIVCFFWCGAKRLHFRLSLSHEFELFRSLHMCASRKDNGGSGTETRYPRALSQPRYQWAILPPHYLIVPHTFFNDLGINKSIIYKRSILSVENT